MCVAGGGCGPVVVIALLPCSQPVGGGGGGSPLTITEVDLALQLLGNKPSPPLKLVLGWVFFQF